MINFDQLDVSLYGSLSSDTTKKKPTTNF